MFNRIEAFHIANTIDNWIDFASKLLTVLEHPFTASQLDLPSRVEKVCARKNHVRIVQVEMSSETHQSDQSDTSERRLRALSRGQINVAFPPNNTVVPNLKRTITLELADNAVGSPNRVMSRLKDSGHLVGNGN